MYAPPAIQNLPALPMGSPAVEALTLPLPAPSSLDTLRRHHWFRAFERSHKRDNGDPLDTLSAADLDMEWREFCATFASFTPLKRAWEICQGYIGETITVTNPEAQGLVSEYWGGGYHLRPIADRQWKVSFVGGMNGKDYVGLSPNDDSLGVQLLIDVEQFAKGIERGALVVV